MALRAAMAGVLEVAIALSEDGVLEPGAVGRTALAAHFVVTPAPQHLTEQPHESDSIWRTITVPPNMKVAL